jgi:hypothetical protein
VSPTLQKTEDVVRLDRAVGSGMAFGTFIVLVAVLIFGIRKLRARALADRAERELREDIDRLGGR